MRPLGDRISEGRRGVRGFGSCRMNCRSGLLLPGTGSRCPHQIFVLQEQFLVNRTGDVRQHSFPIHRGELTETTACAQPPVRPANPWTWVRPSFCTIRDYRGPIQCPPVPLPLTRKFHTLLAGEVTECSENCHAVEGRRDFRAYVKTAWRFCFRPHELKATAKTPTHRASGRREDQSECEKCGLTAIF